MRIFMRKWGTEGPPVVLVHGHVMSSRCMVPLGETLSRHCRVFAPDLPGCGRSERPVCALDIPELADALANAMADEGLERAVLIGNSMGCQVICDLAARRDVATRIVLQSPTMDADARKVHVQLGRFFRSAVHERRLIPLAAIYLSDLMTAGPFRGWETLRFAIRDRLEEKAARIQAPALIVRGDLDFIVGDRWARKLAGVMPNARVVTLPGCAHGLHYSETRAFVDAILSFVLEDENLRNRNTSMKNR